MISDFLTAFTWSDFFLIALIGFIVWALGVYVDARWRQPKNKSSGTDNSPPVKKVWSVHEQQTAPSVTETHPAANHQPYMPRPALDQPLAEQEEPEEEDGQSKEEEIDYETLEIIALDISEVAASLGPNTTDEIILTSIRQALAKFPAVSKPDHRDALNRLVLRCVKQDCSITLSQEQIESIWEADQA